MAGPTDTPSAGSLSGCPVCDALNRVAADAREPCCWRCESPLPGHVGPGTMGARLSGVLALLVAAWVCLLAAELFPFVALELLGQRNAVSLGSAVAALWNEGRVPLAAALAVTLVGAPLGEAAAMLVAVIGLRARDRRWSAHVSPEPAPPWLVNALHVWQGLRHWNLTEVLILAAGVALVKLGQLAEIVIGPALVALMAFMALRLMALRLLPPERAWPLVGLRAA
jgi:paraquat-inducible protein A